MKMTVHHPFVNAALVSGTLVSTMESFDLFFRTGASACALALGVYGVYKNFFKKKK